MCVLTRGWYARKAWSDLVLQTAACLEKLLLPVAAPLLLYHVSTQTTTTPHTQHSLTHTSRCSRSLTKRAAPEWPGC